MRTATRTGLAFADQVAAVVGSGNCSGCGGCVALSPSASMQLDATGQLRPVIDPDVPEATNAAARFAAVCPGAGLTMPAAPLDGRVDPVFGPYLSVWAAWATDDEIRWHGSSGGVLTALATWLLENGRATQAVAATESRTEPGRTVPVQVRTRAEALAAAGSRYAPVANVALLDADQPSDVFIGKPCEAYAARRIVETSSNPGAVILSFFCAGTPSQNATSRLVQELGVELGPTGSVRYRGQGWPGDFVATGTDGSSGRLPYEKAWGERLGRDLQDRCKICPDGTGMHADIAVGDFWEVDERGYPVFTDGAGTSAAIARTRRGHELLLAAQRDGVVALRPIEMSEIAAVQPTQVRRREELPGRLIGRRLAGRAVPDYNGFGLVRTGLRRPLATIRAARGTLARARRIVPAGVRGEG